MADRNRRTGLLVVVGVFALVACGLAFWLLWWSPRQARADAQGQVHEWEVKWAKLRTCLLGDAPLAADPGDALALGELSSGTMGTQARECLDAVKKLNRPEGAESPIGAVELAWATVEDAIPTLAHAFAMRISATDGEVDRRVADLGVAISALDGAHDELRRAAGLTPIVRTGAITLRRLDAPTPVLAGGAPVLATGARIAAGAITGQRFEDTTTEYAVTGPAQAWTGGHRGNEILSVDGGWVVAAAPIDPEATTPPVGQPAIITGPTGQELLNGAVVVAAGSRYVPLAAAGNGAERAIVLEQVAEDGSAQAQPLALATSIDGGVSWALRPDLGLPPGTLNGIGLDYANHTVDVELTVEELDGDDGTRIVHLDAAHPLDGPAVVTPDSFVGFPGTCRRGAAMWFLGADATYQLDGGTLNAFDLPDAGDRVIDCTATAALIEVGGMPVTYQRCTKDGCEEALRGSGYSFGRAAMLDDGRAVYVAGRGRILAMWTEDTKDPAYFKLPAPLSLHAVVVWAGVPFALLHDAEHASEALLAVALK